MNRKAAYRIQEPPYESASVCYDILERTYSMLKSLDNDILDVSGEGPYGKCKRLFRSLENVMPQCFQQSCEMQDSISEYFALDPWIQACQSTVCDVEEEEMMSQDELDTDNVLMTMPRKRRWGDTVLACINSLCNNAAGKDRVNCIVNRCQKRSG